MEIFFRRKGGGNRFKPISFTVVMGQCPPRRAEIGVGRECHRESPVFGPVGYPRINGRNTPGEVILALCSRNNARLKRQRERWVPCWSANGLLLGVSRSS